MGQMYAVVDIETTGTNAKEDQIIQFACTIIENEQIVHTFSTDINPGRPVPKVIQRLTHLDNRRLSKAPYFEDVAETIYHLLSGTVLVAHNVHFDYSFLSKTLKKYGFPNLEIDAIDTVELAQIFMPTIASFRLNDLVETLGFTHERPHQADSDAYVTAQLFLYLTKKIQTIPFDTLRQMIPLTSKLSRQTGEYIQKIYHRRELLNETIDESQFFKVEDLVLRKRMSISSGDEGTNLQSKFPKSKKSKEKYFNNTWLIGKEQAKLMNLLDQHFSTNTDTDQTLILELSTSQFTPELYFLPIEFQSRYNHPTIISYSSEQFRLKWWRLCLKYQEDFSFVNKMMNYYSEESYIDLFKFRLSLNQSTDQKFTALYQMMILVWLTETTTGEWKELGLYNEDNSFFKQLSCQKEANINRPQPFVEVDFITYRNQRLLASQVVLVSQEELFKQTSDSLLYNERFCQILFVEFQYLLDILANSPFASFNSKQAMKFLDSLYNWAKKDYRFLSKKLNDSLDQLQSVVKILAEIQQQFFEDWLDYFDTNGNHVWTRDKELALPIQFYREIRYYLKAYSEVCYLIETLNEQIKEYSGNQEVIFTFSEESTRYAETLQKNYQLLKDWFENWHVPAVHAYYMDDVKRQITFSYYIFAQLHPFFAFLTSKFTKIAATGSGFYLPFDKEYIQRCTQISTKVKRLTFAEEELSVNLLVPNQGISIPETDNSTYIHYLSEQINQFIDKDESCLIVFNSQETLQGVYQAIHEQYFNQGVEIWAVGVNNSLAKVLKRFEATVNPIVFILSHHLSDSNLNKMSFDSVIMARLPFANPQELKIKMYHEYLKTQGLDAFYNDALPQATLRLRRAFDLLDFSKESSFIVLDKRIVNTAYGKKMQKILPKQLIWKEYLHSDTSNGVNSKI